MVSIITHAFVILDMSEGTVTETLMTAALLLVITVRLLNKGKKYRIIQKRNRHNNSSNNDKKEEYQSIFREHMNSWHCFLGHVISYANNAFP